MVKPEQSAKLADFMAEGPLPVVIDDGDPSVYDLYQAQEYELVILGPDGNPVPARRDFSLDKDHDELKALILGLLGAGAEPDAEGAEVVEQLPDAGGTDVSEPEPDAGPEIPDVSAAAELPPIGDAISADVPPDACEAIADFALEDGNPTSPWFGQSIGPADLMGAVYFMYFASAT